MKRGEIWTVAGGTNYAGKPRSAVIAQDDRFDATASITVCAFTTDPTEAPLFRLAVEPNAANGLTVVSRLMVDKLTTVSKSRLGMRIGRLTLLPDSGPAGKVPTDLEGCDDEADEAAVFAGVQGAGGCAPFGAGGDAGECCG